VKNFVIMGSCPLEFHSCNCLSSMINLHDRRITETIFILHKYVEQQKRSFIVFLCYVLYDMIRAEGIFERRK
jgi:hypothetical protein